MERSKYDRVRRWIFLNIGIACVPILVELLLRLKLRLPLDNLVENAIAYLVISFTVSATTLYELLNVKVKAFHKKAVGAIVAALAFFFAWFSVVKHEALLIECDRQRVAVNIDISSWPWALSLSLMLWCACYYVIHRITTMESARSIKQKD